MLVNHQHFITVLNNPISVKNLTYNTVFLPRFFCQYLFVKEI